MPLVFMAQIDLAEVAAKTGKTPLPENGSLAFFIGGEPRVVFVPEGEITTPVMPPDGTPDLSESVAQPSGAPTLRGSRCFPTGR